MKPPYPLSFHKDTGLYIFNTDQGITYTCGFRNITSKLSPVICIYDIEVYDFEFYAFDPIPEIRKPRDERISATIINLLKDFSSNAARVLLYVCDSADRRAKERQMLFNRWHSNISGIINVMNWKLKLKRKKVLILLMDASLREKTFLLWRY